MTSSATPEFWLEISGLGLSVLGFALMAIEWWISARDAEAASKQELAGKHHVPPKKVRDAYRDLTEVKTRLLEQMRAKGGESADLKASDVVRIIQLAEVGAIQSSAREISLDKAASSAQIAVRKRLRYFALGAVTTTIGFALQFAATLLPHLTP